MKGSTHTLSALRQEKPFPPDVSCPGGLILLGTENGLQLRFSPCLRLISFWQKTLGEHGCDRSLMGHDSLAQGLKTPGPRFRGMSLKISYTQKEHEVRTRLVTGCAQQYQTVTQKSLIDLSSPCFEEGTMMRWMKQKANHLQRGRIICCNDIFQINRPG